MSISLQWLGHASFKIVSDGTVIYIDPWKLEEAVNDGTVILVSHSHYDHYSMDDIGKAVSDHWELITTADVISEYGMGDVIKPGETKEFDGGGKVTAVAAYNLEKEFHPKENEWVGFVIEIGGKRIYYAGDTDITEEMAGLTGIDLALLPVGGTYTMNAAEAAAATGKFQPSKSLPYHWGDIVGQKNDAETFKAEAVGEVVVLQPGETMEV
ncbi:MAG: MBL fold metallo-hydrolase [Planctomycetes bacterium]|nr:MBL fold metallo-hydrolase [Planctomycetota bacterium]